MRDWLNEGLDGDYKMSLSVLRHVIESVDSTIESVDSICMDMLIIEWVDCIM